MTVTGTLANINTALNGTAYQPAQLQRQRQPDRHHQRPGQHRRRRRQTDTDTVAITVTAVNDAPVNTRARRADHRRGHRRRCSRRQRQRHPSPTSTCRPPARVQVTLAVTNGTLTLGGAGHLSGLVAGNGTATRHDLHRHARRDQHRPARPGLPPDRQLQRQRHPDDHHQRPGQHRRRRRSVRHRQRRDHRQRGQRRADSERRVDDSRMRRRSRSTSRPSVRCRDRCCQPDLHDRHHPTATQGVLTATATNGVFSFDSSADFNGTAASPSRSPTGATLTAAPRSRQLRRAQSSAVKAFTVTVSPVNDQADRRPRSGQPRRPTRTTPRHDGQRCGRRDRCANRTFKITDLPDNGTLKRCHPAGPQRHFRRQPHGADLYAGRQLQRHRRLRVQVTAAVTPTLQQRAVLGGARPRDETSTITVNPVNDVPTAADGHASRRTRTRAVVVDLAALVVRRRDRRRRPDLHDRGDRPGARRADPGAGTAPTRRTRTTTAPTASPTRSPTAATPTTAHARRACAALRGARRRSR